MDFCRSGGDLQKIPSTTRPDHVWPDVLRIEKNRNGKKINQSSRRDDFTLSIVRTEKTKKLTKKREEKLERPMAPTMPCKRQSSITKVVAKPEIASEKNAMPCKAPNDITKVSARSENASETPRTMNGTVEFHESTTQRVESSQLKNHEDHIASKGFFSMSHYNLVHKIIPLPQARKISDAKSSSR